MNTGLYSHDDARDNCGFGMIAHMSGEASHDLLQTAIESLTRMTHRGAVAADGKTGDGCGVLIQKPDAFLREEAKSLFGREPAGEFAVGMVFLNPDPELAAAGRDALQSALVAEGLNVMGWREVPCDDSVLGEIARLSYPRIEQIFVEPASSMRRRFAVGYLWLEDAPSAPDNRPVTAIFMLPACQRRSSSIRAW